MVERFRLSVERTAERGRRLRGSGEGNVSEASATGSVEQADLPGQSRKSLGTRLQDVTRIRMPHEEP
jgi:hypothetical protein